MRGRASLGVRIATGFLVGSLASISAAAQEWPSRPMTMVVPYAAGGTADAVARILAAGLTQTLGQQVIVENVGGAGGMTGANRVAKATPDGYQFVFGSTGNIAQNQTLYKKPLYNSATEFAPVMLVAEQAVVLVARKDLPADSLQEFIAYAKANQARMQYGSPGAGSAPHLACALLNSAIGVNVTHVPYRGGGQAMQDLVAGRIDYQCPINTVALPQLESHAIKAIAVLSRGRSPSLPGVASAREQGLEDFETPYWNGVFLPRETPEAIVQKLHDAVATTIDDPTVQERMRKIGAEPVPPTRRSPQYLKTFVESEIGKWGKIIKASGVTMD
jgi:tripartite-type tricarboxylate transporter receptor subunit TctC